MKTFTLIIFIIIYISMLLFPKQRSLIAFTGGILMMIFNILPIKKVFTYVDLNVLMILFGTMGIVFLFIQSKMPALLAEKIVKNTKNIKWAIISLSIFAGIISAFVDNVATVLMVAPIAVSICKKMNISPVKAVIAISISSNLQGAATLVGDTTSIILGSYLNLSFGDFFIIDGKIGMFFITQIAAITSALVLLYIFRKDNQSVKIFSTTKVNDCFPSLLLIFMIFSLISISFIKNKSSFATGAICIILFFIGILYEVLTRKNKRIFIETIKNIDYNTIIMITGVFIMIGGLIEIGIIKDISQIIKNLSKNNIFILYTLIVFLSTIFSAFIDNIPYITAMLPIINEISSTNSSSHLLLFFGLLIGATLGGNITPIGASSNITGIGILRKEGYLVKTSDFMKISIPFSLVALLTGYILVWFIWS